MGNHVGESSFQTKMLTDYESNIRKILKRNEGIWFSDFWMKVLVIFLFVYTRRYLVLRFLDESLGDIFVSLYTGIGAGCILRYINYHGFAR